MPHGMVPSINPGPTAPKSTNI
uniref:Uncharacterized protein n=1 Tax=Arundo donax TaxID=35708 RepID=A0A0A8Y3X0_ARUDO